MNEEFTSLTLAYLFDELAPAARAEFAARLETNPAERAEVRAIADTLGRYAAAGTAGARMTTTERNDIRDAILEQVRPVRPIAWARFAWPAAAAVLLGLNIVQWIQSHRASSAPQDENIGLSDPATADRAPDLRPAAGAPTQHAGLQRAPLAKTNPVAPAPAPAIRQSLIFSMTQTTAVARTPAPVTASLQQGSIDLHNLPNIPAERRLYLWALRTGASGFEPVGEIPRQIYGSSGTIKYQLRPGTGAPAKFEITIEPTGADVPIKPSSEVVCSGP